MSRHHHFRDGIASVMGMQLFGQVIGGKPAPERGDTGINLTTTGDTNPTTAIHNCYQELMAIEDVDTLKLRATAVVVDAGMSKKNQRKFDLTLSQIGDLVPVQQFITNFLMRGMGHGAIR